MSVCVVGWGVVSNRQLQDVSMCVFLSHTHTASAYSYYCDFDWI